MRPSAKGQSVSSDPSGQCRVPSQRSLSTRHCPPVTQVNSPSLQVEHLSSSDPSGQSGRPSHCWLEVRQEPSLQVSSGQAGQLISSVPPAQSGRPSHTRLEGRHGGAPEPQRNSVLEQVGGGGGEVSGGGVGQSSSSVPSTQSAVPSHRWLESIQAPASHLHSAELHRSKHRQIIWRYFNLREFYVNLHA